MSKDRFCEGVRHIGESCKHYLNEASKASHPDKNSEEEQKQACNNDEPYEHYCRGRYQGNISLPPHESEDICPTCEGLLGQNKCSLEKSKQ